MSIRDEINRQCEAKAIHRVLPEDWPNRELYLSDAIYGRSVLGLGLGLTRRDQKRWYNAGLDLRRFTDRKLLLVRDEPRGRVWGSDDSQLARLEPIDREVWEYRSLANPQMRFFGRFAARDCFVVLGWAWKKELLRDRAAYPDAMLACETTWTNLFRGEPPLTNGAYPHDYLTRYRIAR